MQFEVLIPEEIEIQAIAEMTNESGIGPPNHIMLYL